MKTDISMEAAVAAVELLRRPGDSVRIAINLGEFCEIELRPTEAVACDECVPCERCEIYEPPIDDEEEDELLDD